jgi:hypothetical protein
VLKVMATLYVFAALPAADARRAPEAPVQRPPVSIQNDQVQRISMSFLGDQGAIRGRSGGAVRPKERLPRRGRSSSRPATNLPLLKHSSRREARSTQDATIAVLQVIKMISDLIFPERC